MNRKIVAILATVLALSLAFVFTVPAVDQPKTGSNAAASPVTATAATTTRIEEYEVMYSANVFVPRIWLKAKGSYIGQLIFRPDGSTLPSDSISGTLVNLYYHLSDFQNCMDMLRNENPVYLVWSGASSENGVKTMAEPVGEEDNALTVASPNGGQSWARSNSYAISWTWVGSPGANVKIDLMKGGVVNRVISYSTANDGSYTWTVPAAQTVGSDYRIRITSTSITLLSDISDAYFSVT